MKKFKTSLLVIAFTLIFFTFIGTNINATEINSVKDLKTFFDGKDVTITGSTVKLNSDVVIEDVMDIMDGEYTFDLNGKTLKITEIYILGGKININGIAKGAKVDSRWISIEGKDSSLIADGCLFETDDTYTWDNGENEEIEEVKTVIDNWGGTVVIKNGSIEDSIWNTDGHMTLENVTVPIICQQGDAIIKGGKYESFSTDISYCKTTIYGGEFINKGEESHAFIINDNKVIDPFTINSLLPEGYVATYDEFDLDYYEYDGTENYTGFWNNTIKIVKKEEATKTYSEAFNKVAPDGVLKVEGLKPTSVDDSEFLLSAVVNDIVEPLGYEATSYAYCKSIKDESGQYVKDVYIPEIALVSLRKDGIVEERYVKVQYMEPTAEKAKMVNAVLDKMKYYKDYSELRVDNAYILEDLYLINYLFANTSSSKIKGAQALNFSKELIEATGGANISFRYDSRNGSGNPYALYSYSSGQAVVYVGDDAYTSRYASLTASHVIYVPEGEYKNADEYIAAALKRIEDYMGKETVKAAKLEIKVGGKINQIQDVGESYNEYNLFDETKADNNYYVVKINGKSYNFAICEKETSKLEAPKYVGMNLGNNITIKSNSSAIPLDTAVTAKQVKNDTIKKALGTDVYSAFDISLFSNAKNTKITKLEDGTFNVSIPLSDALKGLDKDDIAVYYIDSEGKVVEHKADVKENMVSFNTYHFSTYAIAEKIQINPSTITNPNTLDSILIAVATLLLSMTGIVVAVKYIKK